ncbi:MAG: 50S ribosomal protein L22 [Candidatus Peregrinibacteria bacterium]|nr:50S ribosomal protein L22 [Candidatus Peregrinibacteria bacterium]
MKAYLHAAHIAPKKANLIAKMVRGMSVPDAVEALRRTNKKAARMIEDLLRSAMANASHNDKQDPQMMVIKMISVDQGQALRRGVPMARGRVRPIRKFMCHISLTLGYPEVEETASEKKASKAKGSSQKPKNAVQQSRASAKTKKETSSSPASS